MNARRFAGRSRLRPSSRFSISRTAFGLTALLTTGIAACLLSRANAIEMTTVVGFRLPGTEKPSDGTMNPGLYRSDSFVPVSCRIEGKETGDAQMQATVEANGHSTVTTRPVHLDGKPQTCPFVLSFQQPNSILTLSLLQKGRRLATQQTYLSSSLPRRAYTLLSLSSRPDQFVFLRRGKSSIEIQREPGYSAEYENEIPETQIAQTAPSRQSLESDMVPFLLVSEPESLPNTAQGYGTVDCIVLTADYPVEKITAEQAGSNARVCEAGQTADFYRIASGHQSFCV